MVEVSSEIGKKWIQREISTLLLGDVCIKTHVMDTRQKLLLLRKIIFVHKQCQRVTLHESLGECMNVSLPQIYIFAKH
ncbi:CLUMA_CG012786, isoform A [Clunio marinus]|uniref:CLUMA_CG012786, isoform A n=1 Tax=Clunio marinus TaxID=568069 RepID=A0A1J1IGR8_9DIPT|nr:CLUMA_CG012786, isoform A [Clunio marinus]